VLGVEYFIGDLDSATAAVLERVRGGRGGYACLCGVHGIVTAQHSDALMGALHEAWLNFPDGAPVAWLMRRMGAGRARRVAGPDLMPRVIEAGQDAGLVVGQGELHRLFSPGSCSQRRAVRFSWISAAPEAMPAEMARW